MLAHRLRRWPNIETALDECHVFAGTEAASTAAAAAAATLAAIAVLRLRTSGAAFIPENRRLPSKTRDVHPMLG